MTTTQSVEFLSLEFWYFLRFRRKLNMMVLHASSLEKRGIHYRTSKQIQVRGRTFQKAESFSKRVYEVALAHCEQQQVEGTLCLLVESEAVLTIWREVKKTPPSTSPCQSQIFNRSAYYRLLGMGI